jgi:hypothetical protein
MKRSTHFPSIAATVKLVAVLALTPFVLTSCAARPRAPLPDDYLRNLACRIVTVTRETTISVEPLIDVNLDTASGHPEDATFSAEIAGGRVLGATVRHVRSDLPGDRFNVAMTLDGKTHLRLNRADLDIYVETVIDGRTYALHCFPEFAMTPEMEQPVE